MSEPTPTVQEAHASCRFYVMIQDVAQAVFTEVSGLQIETEIFEYAEGGNVVWLAVMSNAGAKAEDMKAFAEKHNLPYPILMDGDGKVGKAYGAKTTPHLFVVDKAGKLAYMGGNVFLGDQVHTVLHR